MTNTTDFVALNSGLTLNLARVCYVVNNGDDSVTVSFGANDKTLTGIDATELKKFVQRRADKLKKIAGMS